MSKHNIRPRGWKRMSGIAQIAVYAFGTIVVLALIGGLTWCSQTGCEGDRDNARRIVESAGYDKVEVGGAHQWKCGRDDGRSNTFTAISPNGKYVEGVVCCSAMGCAKGCTLRFE